MFKILVVEDDRDLNHAVCNFLGQNGYEAIGCLSANEAYDAMYGGTLFDMIVSDIMMPGVDGFEFAQTIRELNQEIPILFMTARDDFSAKQRGFKADRPRRAAPAHRRAAAPGEDRQQPQAGGRKAPLRRRRAHCVSGRRGNLPDGAGV